MSTLITFLLPELMLRILCNPIMLPVAFNISPLSCSPPVLLSVKLHPSLPFSFSLTPFSLFLTISVRRWWTSWSSYVAISIWIQQCTPWSCSHLRETPWDSSPTFSWAHWMWPVFSLRRKCWRRKWHVGLHPKYQRWVKMGTATWCYFRMMETYFGNIQ